MNKNFLRPLFYFLMLVTDACMAKIMKVMEKEEERIKEREVEVMREWILNKAVSKRFPLSW
jgi:hypothetical protein